MCVCVCVCVSLFSDVLQAALQCNNDFQFVDRAAPCRGADDASACDAERASTFELLHVMRVWGSLHVFALRADRVAWKLSLCATSV